MDSAPLCGIDEVLLNQNPDAVVIVTPSGTIRDWSGGAERVFGYSAKEAVGRKLVDLLVPAGHCEEQKQSLLVTAESGSATFESLRSRKDGTKL